MATSNILRVLAAMLCVATTLAALANVGLAQAPPLLPVQGYASDENGTPLDGSYTVTFELFDTDVGGGSLYTTTVDSLVIEEGYFTSYLGDLDPLDLAMFRDHAVVWLEITVGTETLSPRLQVGTVGFAALASYCGDAETVGGATVMSCRSV